MSTQKAYTRLHTSESKQNNSPHSIVQDSLHLWQHIHLNEWLNHYISHTAQRQDRSKDNCKLIGAIALVSVAGDAHIHPTLHHRRYWHHSQQNLRPVDQVHWENLHYEIDKCKSLGQAPRWEIVPHVGEHETCAHNANQLVSVGPCLYLLHQIIISEG